MWYLIYLTKDFHSTTHPMAHMFTIAHWYLVVHHPPNCLYVVFSCPPHTQLRGQCNSHWLKSHEMTLLSISTTHPIAYMWYLVVHHPPNCLYVVFTTHPIAYMWYLVVHHPPNCLYVVYSCPPPTQLPICGIWLSTTHPIA